MRLLCKIIALPFLLILTVATAFLTFLRVIGEGLLAVVAVVFALLGIFGLVTAGGNPFYIRSGIIALVLGFLISPLGLPALAAWLIGLLDNIKYTLQDFMVS